MTLIVIFFKAISIILGRRVKREAKD